MGAGADSKYQEAADGLRRGGNTRAANDALVEYAWMLLQRGEEARGAAMLRTVDRLVLLDAESLASYAEGYLENAGGDPANAESVVSAALAKDAVPYRTAIGLDVLMAIAVRAKNAAKAQVVAQRYAALARSIPEDGEVRRGAVRAMAQAEITAGDRAGDAVRQLPQLLREATRLGHAVEVSELQQMIRESGR